MNFFEHQDRARRHTGRLVLLMGAAVLSLIIVTSGVLIVILRSQKDLSVNFSNWQLLLDVSIVVFAVVLLGSLYKTIQLRAGGKVIAERLGGRLINLAPQGLDERRMLNIVEEMAIASGTPVPAVYVLDDTSINAFAAGLTPQDAVIGVTRGAVALLNREELQGVIAHEFSHIYNGDMRLNTRLTAVIHGLLLLGLIGALILRGVSYRGSSSSSNKSGNNGAMAIMAVGGALWVLGYTGTFFGNLIKAAVSREREFLADASAVQFTRNPQSIAGALKKIGGHAQGSQLQAAHAAEFSHLYFGAGVKAAMSGMMATHPPLEVRIQRVDPQWNGQFPAVEFLGEAPPPSTGFQAGLNEPAPAKELVFDLLAIQQSIAAIGEPGPEHLDHAQSALNNLPGALREAAHSSNGAQALICGLLLDPIPVLQAQQMERLLPKLAPDIARQLEALRPDLTSLDQHLRLPLIDLAIPALKQLSTEQFKTFRSHLALLILADDRIDLLEWTLLRIVERNVLGAPKVTAKYSLHQVTDDIALLLGALARAGNSDPAHVRKAFDQASAGLPLPALALNAAGANEWQDLETALNRLRQLKPLEKPTLLKAMAVCIEQDGQITPAEAELMRAVADVLDCPMPPLLATP
ncbi:M48 family metallopeptidase [Pseudomonas fluorescens]|uniref:M48 family metallopeptidase n=1 Tax=Pseudomonas fluorescens TaxID=294 RepID=UPI001BEBF1FE|nr:M48 family metallopeptidase [Pseudomonas fluorescens]MBT2370563.1 M48 family metalloprotease [Pseudomonas fluorescens]